MKNSIRRVLALALALALSQSTVYGAAWIKPNRPAGTNSGAAEAVSEEETKAENGPRNSDANKDSSGRDDKGGSQDAKEPPQEKPADTPAVQPADQASDADKSAAENTSSGNTAGGKTDEEDPSLVLAGAVLPSNFSQGHEVTIAGTIAADIAIDRVEIGVATSKGVWLSGHKLDRKNLGQTSYNVVNATSSVNFLTLPVGKYQFRIVATASNGESAVLASKAFSVTEATAAVALTQQSIPAQFNQGSVPSISGTITSDVRIKRIEIGLVSASNKNVWVTGAKYDNPKLNVRTFDISKATSQIAFAKLPAGTYYYRIYVHTQNGLIKTLLNQQIVVKSNTPVSKMAEKVVQVMESQVGTKTGKKYWEWYYGTKFRNTDATPWCGAFVAWVYDQAGALGQIKDVEKYGNLGYVPSYTKYAAANKKVVSTKNAKGGDIIIFGSGNGTHVGLVEKVEGATITTIEGNAGATARNGGLGAVVRNTYSISSGWIKEVVSVLK